MFVRSVKEAMQCFREAIGDCRKNQNIPEETINNLEAQIDTYDQMLSGHCDSGELVFSLSPHSPTHPPLRPPPSSTPLPPPPHNPPP